MPTCPPAAIPRPISGRIRDRPSIGSPTGSLATTPQAIQQLFNWFFANGGTGRPYSLVDIPGVSTVIGGSLNSPNVNEWAVGLSKLFDRGSIRADYVYRKYADFYATRADTSTGKTQDKLGNEFDLSLIENTDVVNRNYKGVTFQVSYRPMTRMEIGGNYTISRSGGQFRRRGLGKRTTRRAFCFSSQSSCRPAGTARRAI